MIELIQNVLYTPLFSHVDMSAPQTSPAQVIQGISLYCVQFSWTGFSGSGSEVISTEGSNDGIVWTTVDSFIPTGTTGNRLLNVEKAGYRFVQLVYAPASSSGSLSATISGKVI